MSKPITSRVKRSPLLKYSPAKQTADVGGFTPGEDKTVTKTEIKEKDSVGAYRRACGSTTDGSTKTDPKTGASFKCAQAPKGQEPKETETVTTTTTELGEDQEWEGTLKTETKGDVLQPWEKRRMSRGIKKEQRDIRRAKIKAAKKAGTLTPEMRKKIKADEATAELEEFEAMASRGKTARASGKRTGTSNVHTGQRDMTQSELDKKEQEEMLKRKSESKARSEAAEEERSRAAKESGVVTGQAVKAIDAPAPAAPPAPKAGSSAGENDLYASSKGYSAFKMKAKSPVAKKLQGNQNKLPQHLQDAIKAAPESPAKLGPLAAIAGKALIGAAANKLASSNKMRSGFKMKGYGKK